MSLDHFSPEEMPDYPPEVPPFVDARAARDRVQIPGTLLIVVGALNLLVALGLFALGAQYASMSPEQLEQAMKEANPQQARQMRELERQGWSAQDILNIGSRSGFGGGTAACIVALLGIIGGVRMIVLRNYGLAVFASVLTAVPCLSPSACCLLGEGVGLWALIVLLNPDVRSAFR